MLEQPSPLFSELKSSPEGGVHKNLFGTLQRGFRSLVASAMLLSSGSIFAEDSSPTTGGTLIESKKESKVGERVRLPTSTFTRTYVDADKREQSFAYPIPRVRVSTGETNVVAFKLFPGIQVFGCVPQMQFFPSQAEQFRSLGERIDAHPPSLHHWKRQNLGEFSSHTFAIGGKHQKFGMKDDLWIDGEPTELTEGENPMQQLLDAHFDLIASFSNVPGVFPNKVMNVLRPGDIVTFVQSEKRGKGSINGIPKRFLLSGRSFVDRENLAIFVTKIGQGPLLECSFDEVARILRGLPGFASADIIEVHREKSDDTSSKKVSSNPSVLKDEHPISERIKP